MIFDANGDKALLVEISSLSRLLCLETPFQYEGGQGRTKQRPNWTPSLAFHTCCSLDISLCSTKSIIRYEQWKVCHHQTKRKSPIAQNGKTLKFPLGSVWSTASLRHPQDPRGLSKYRKKKDYSVAAHTTPENSTHRSSHRLSIFDCLSMNVRHRIARATLSKNALILERSLEYMCSCNFKEAALREIFFPCLRYIQAKSIHNKGLYHNMLSVCQYRLKKGLSHDEAMKEARLWNLLPVIPNSSFWWWASDMKDKSCERQMIIIVEDISLSSSLRATKIDLQPSYPLQFQSIHNLTQSYFRVSGHSLGCDFWLLQMVWPTKPGK